MRTHATAAVILAIAVPLIAPVVLTSPAQADDAGYRRCVGNIAELPLNEPDPRSLQLSGEIEQDLNAGVSPAAEAQKVAQTGFDAHTAQAIVQCVAEENP